MDFFIPKNTPSSSSSGSGSAAAAGGKPSTSILTNDSTSNDNNITSSTRSVDTINGEAAPIKTADEILIQEMMSLNVNDRNNIQEEIHGVMCLAPDETPQFLEESLHNLNIELKKNYPLLLKKLSPTSYINTQEMRLQFLRVDFFDIKKTASRINSFLNCHEEYYGNYALERPIQVTDFTKDELKIVRKGLCQLLPFRDRSGRRTLIFFQGTESVQVDSKTMVKIFLYFNFVLGYKDIDAQRKGCILIIWLVDAHSNSFPLRSLSSGASSSGVSSSESSATTSLIRRIQMRAKLHSASCIRASAIHICTPAHDTPICRLRRSLIINMVGILNRSRLKIHLGESMELRYVLQCFGIDTDNLPISWTGTIKNGYVKQWVWIRKYIEDNVSNTTATTTTAATTTTSIGSSIIECPQLNDIIFKKGTSASSHPGNVMFKSMIQLKYEQCTKIPTKSLIKEIIQKIHEKKLRILFWNEDNQWWSLFDDEKQIYKKIEYIVRDFRFSSKRSQTINRTTTTGTSAATTIITTKGGQKQQASSNIPPAVTSTSTSTSTSSSTPSSSPSILPRMSSASASASATARSRPPPTQPTSLHSDTSIFLQDGGNSNQHQQRKRFKSDDGCNNIKFFNYNNNSNNNNNNSNNNTYINMTVPTPSASASASSATASIEPEPKPSSSSPSSSSSSSVDNAVESSFFGLKYFSF